MAIEKPSAGSIPAGQIEVRQTPNPNARKFVVAGTRFEGSRNYSLGNVVDDALAAQLLGLEGVYNVFMAQDFVTVNKVPQIEWLSLQSAVENILSDYFDLSQSAKNNAG